MKPRAHFAFFAMQRSEKMSCDHIHALDLAKAGKWDTAHRLVQEYSDARSCLIHGYLHRLEGDLSNANYWYRRAGEVMPDNTVEEEAKRIHEILAQ